MTKRLWCPSLGEAVRPGWSGAAPRPGTLALLAPFASEQELPRLCEALWRPWGRLPFQLAPRSSQGRKSYAIRARGWFCVACTSVKRQRAIAAGLAGGRTWVRAFHCATLSKPCAGLGQRQRVESGPWGLLSSAADQRLFSSAGQELAIFLSSQRRAPASDARAGQRQRRGDQLCPGRKVWTSDCAGKFGACFSWLTGESSAAITFRPYIYITLSVASEPRCAAGPQPAHSAQADGSICQCTPAVAPWPALAFFGCVRFLWHTGPQASRRLFGRSVKVRKRSLRVNTMRDGRSKQVLQFSACARARLVPRPWASCNELIIRPATPSPSCHPAIDHVYQQSRPSPCRAVCPGQSQTLVPLLLALQRRPGIPLLQRPAPAHPCRLASMRGSSAAACSGWTLGWARSGWRGALCCWLGRFLLTRVCSAAGAHGARVEQARRRPARNLEMNVWARRRPALGLALLTNRAGCTGALAVAGLPAPVCRQAG